MTVHEEKKYHKHKYINTYIHYSKEFINKDPRCREFMREHELNEISIS